MTEARTSDLLLEWCSLRGRGGRADFDSACQTALGSDAIPSAVLSRMEQLGHVDVDWTTGRRWWVTPTLLVIVAGAGGRASVTGARSRGMLSELQRAFQAGEIPSLELVPQRVDAPSSWYVGFRSERDLTDIADRIGATVVGDVQRLYKEHFGTLSQVLESARREFNPSGFEAERLDPETLYFERMDGHGQLDLPGCFRQPSHGGYRYYFVDDRAAVYSPDRWTATHAELARRRKHGLAEGGLLAYDVRTHQMGVAAGAQLPLPWARVAVAASGRLPRRVAVSSTGNVDVFDGIEPLLFKQIIDALDAPAISMSFATMEDA